MTGLEAPAAGRGPRRIGVFGGSFDPVHQAHIALGRVACAALQLDELRWVPAGQPWQKARQLAEGRHRVAMLELAVAAAAADLAAGAGSACRQRVDAMELQRSGPSYTEDTLAAVAAEQPGAELFLIIGQDQYANLPTWRGWQRIVQLAALAVAARAGAVVQAPPELAAVPHRLYRLPLPAMAASSTAVREHLKQGGSAQALVPALLAPAVAGYIDQHHLYRHAAPDKP